MDPLKTCDNCCKCIESSCDFHSIEIDKIFEDSEEYEEYNEHKKKE